MSVPLRNMKYNLNKYRSVIYLFVDLLSLNLMQNCSIHSQVNVFANVFTSYNFVGTVVIYIEQGTLLFKTVPTFSSLYSEVMLFLAVLWLPSGRCRAYKII